MPSVGFTRFVPLVGAFLVGAVAADTTPPRRDASQLTLKERSAGKAMDEQRVNDCKVPFDQRGDHHRSPECAKK